MGQQWQWQLGFSGLQEGPRLRGPIPAAYRPILQMTLRIVSYPCGLPGEPEQRASARDRDGPCLAWTVGKPPNEADLTLRPP
jgi:hypothetical protein